MNTQCKRHRGTVTVCEKKESGTKTIQENHSYKILLINPTSGIVPARLSTPHPVSLVITMSGLPPPITDLHNVTAVTPNLEEEDRRVSDEEKYQTGSETSSPSESTVELQKRYVDRSTVHSYSY
jgi:hypothetical protein